MVIGLLQARVHIPQARSLKDKRMALRSLKDRVTSRMNVSVGEVGCQDVWQTADLAFVTVSAQKNVSEKRLAEIATLVRSDPRYVLTDIETHWL